MWFHICPEIMVRIVTYTKEFSNHKNTHSSYIARTMQIALHVYLLLRMKAKCVYKSLPTANTPTKRKILIAFLV